MNRKSNIQKLPSLQGWVSQQVFSRCWNLEEVGSSATEEMDLLTRLEQAGKEQKFPASLSLYRLPEECMVQIKGLCLTLSKVWIRSGSTHFKPSKINFIAVLSISELEFIQDLVKVTVKNDYLKQ